MSNIPSPGYIQTTARSPDEFSFSKEPSSHNPIAPNLSPYGLFSTYHPPVQQPAPSYSQARYSSYPYTLQEENDTTCPHEPSDFSLSLHTNPVSVLRSYTNTPILHQNSSPGYEQHPPSSLTDGPPQRHRLDVPHLASFTPASATVAHYSPPSPSPASIKLSSHADQPSSITVSLNDSDHSKVHKESSHIVWQHVKQQGKLKSVCSLKMLFCGPPETGKTIAMRRLTNQIRCLDPNSPAIDSTVLEKPCTVQLIHKSSVLIADHESWNFEESVKEQGCSIYSLIINSSHSSTTTATGSDASEQEAMVNRSIEEVTRLAQAEEWEEITKKLSGIKDVTILHVIDSGGQPECHEILPLLLDGQVLSLIFLDLSKNLNDKHAVSFHSCNRYAEAHNEKFPPSEFTTQEVLHHILTSIMSLQSVDDGSCNSIAVLVGTHLDKVSTSQVHGLDLKLQDAFKHFIDNGLLCSTDTGDDEEESYIATLNNMTDDQEDIDRLRKLILEVVDTQFRKRQEQGIPTGWLLLHLLLRDKYQDQGWCSMADCIATAKSCGIKEEDVPKVLDAIHKNYGTLLFYPSVIEYVICDPNVIVSPLKSVFEFVFACSIRTKRAIARSIRDTGEITEKELMECFKASSRAHHLPSCSLIALFKHRYILCEIMHSACDGQKFFMPCLLKTDANAISHRERLLSSPAPVLFVAWSKLCGCYNSPTPLGLFPAVVVDLSGTWNCTMCKVRFRNRIQFDVKDKESGATFTVELCKYATYIELCLKRCPNTGKILANLQQQVLDSLQRVSEKYTHMKPIKWEIGFYCPSSLEEGGNPHPAVLNGVGNAPIVDMTCCFKSCSCGRIFYLEEKHKCWLAKVSMLSINNLNSP